jgi:protein-tyrosine phosphatase
VRRFIDRSLGGHDPVDTVRWVVSALRDVRVERDDQGALLVWWHAEHTIDIGIGATPVASEHTSVATAVGGGMVRIEVPLPHRAYVSLVSPGRSAVVAAERRVPFEGITNLRDLGGYPIVGGGVTKWGQVFRADALHKLTADDLARFRELGVMTVYDLRGDVERAEFPGPFPSLHVSIVGRPRDSEPSPPPPEMTARNGEELLRDTYVGALTHSAVEIGAIMRGLCDPRLTPAVFHCHGGKDRTGIVAVVLLLALGVDRDIVLDDYEATSLYRSSDDQHDSLATMLRAGISPEAAAAVLGTPRWAMAEAVDVLLGLPGGVAGFLTGPAGMEPGELDALREHLVTPTESER